MNFRMVFCIISLVIGSSVSYGQHAEIVKFDRLQSIVQTKSDQVQIINFWATWCAPCVKELPLFQSLEDKHDPSLKITLVSLDFADKVESVNNFITKKKLSPDVILLDEPDYNSWIDRVDKEWTGAIPATLFVNTQTGQRKLVERELKPGELEKYILEVKNYQKN